MSRKHYVALAKTLAGSFPIDENWQQVSDYWQYLVDKLADTLAADNPKFDRNRFLHACRKGE